MRSLTDFDAMHLQMKYSTLHCLSKGYSPLDLLLHVDVATVSYLLKFGTSQNEPNPSKTSQNQPKQLKKNCETTWNNPMLQKWGNLEFSTSFHFSNFESKCPNLGIFGEAIFQQNFTSTLFWIWAFCVKKY